MEMVDIEILEKLDKTDQEKLLYFAKLLLKQKKYRKLKEEIENRKKEIERGEIFTHDEIWNKLDV